MSRICDLTGKAALTGNNVSHSNVKINKNGITAAINKFIVKGSI